MARVKKAGGSIHTNKKLCHPIWNPEIINIGVTRAIGAVYFKNPKFTEGKSTGLIATPFIKEYIIGKQDEFIILATDGYTIIFKKFFFSKHFFFFSLDFGKL